MPVIHQEIQAKAQAIYMDYLLREAKLNLLLDSNELPVAFDPQGRFLTEITLSASQYQSIVERINAELSPEQKPFPLSKAGLTAALGLEPTVTTMVSIDITEDTVVFDWHDVFIRRLDKALTDDAAVDDPLIRRSILEALEKTPKGSIIALQQEFHAHLALASRVYQALTLPDGTRPFLHQEDAIKAAHQAALLRVNTLVMAVYAQGLHASMVAGELDVARLNHALDKARATIMPMAHTFLMEEIIKKTSVVLPDAAFKQAKAIAQQTPAIPDDILHTDSRQGVALLIKGSEVSAHYRQKGSVFAHRPLITHAFQAGIITPHQHPRLHIRVPSLAVKKGLLEEEYVHDVADKLKEVTTVYHLKEDGYLDGDDVGKPKAFIYNLYTAINHRLGDLRGNLQTQSLRHILQGAHRYNHAQLTTGSPVFCFVQNLSVNGFGNELGYDGNRLSELLMTMGFSSDTPDLPTVRALRIEATLMAEMALLHTLYEMSESKEQQADIAAVFALYKDYLKQADAESYFSQSPWGKTALQTIKAIKTQWQQSEYVNLGGGVVDNAQSSLKNLMAYDAHFKHDYSKLIQTLSVFVEKVSLGGCKSGNERAQSINGRVMQLDAVLHRDPPTPEGLRIKTALAQLALAKGAEDVDEAAKVLKTAIDSAYNQTGLQAGASCVSLADQGGPSKVDAKPNHGFLTSTNQAEEPAAVMNLLSQHKAGGMQFKNLATQMPAAWHGHPKTWWSRMTSNPLGVTGTMILGVLLLPITLLVGIGVAIYNAYDNYQRNSTMTQSNDALRIQYFNDVKQNMGKGSYHMLLQRMKPRETTISEKQATLATVEPQQAQPTIQQQPPPGYVAEASEDEQVLSFKR